MMRAALLRDLPLSELASSVNAFLHDAGTRTRYATMLSLRLHVFGLLEYVNCGHIPAIISSGGRSYELPESNFVVGLFKVVDFKSSSVTMQPGDRLLLVTDGVTECEDIHGEQFGSLRLTQAFLENQTVDHIFDTVSEYSSSKDPEDDWTMLEVTYMA
jgi:sigma-B regulation protein RsbU (phosphoserine phosphatase)